MPIHTIPPLVAQPRPKLARGQIRPGGVVLLIMASFYLRFGASGNPGGVQFKQILDTIAALRRLPPARC